MAGQYQSITGPQQRQRHFWSIITGPTGILEECVTEKRLRYAMEEAMRKEEDIKALRQSAAKRYDIMMAGWPYSAPAAWQRVRARRGDIEAGEAFMRGIEEHYWPGNGP